MSSSSLSLVDAGHESEVERERYCTLMHSDLTSSGRVYDQERYDDCIEARIAHDSWMDTRGLIAGIVILVIIVGVVIAIIKAKPLRKYSEDTDYSYTSTVRKGWTPDEKEQVRIRQDGKCAHCGKPPPRWEYHHVNGDRSDNSMSNCEGLCPNCHSIETNEG